MLTNVRAVVCPRARFLKCGPLCLFLLKKPHVSCSLGSLLRSGCVAWTERDTRFFSFSSSCYGYRVSALGVSSCQFQTGFPLDAEIHVHPDIKGPFVQVREGFWKCTVMRSQAGLESPCPREWLARAPKGVCTLAGKPTWWHPGCSLDVEWFLGVPFL